MHKQRWTVEDITPTLDCPHYRNVNNLRAMVNKFPDVEISDDSTLLEVRDILLDKIRSKDAYADLICNQMWASVIQEMHNDIAELMKDFKPRFGLRKN